MSLEDEIRELRLAIVALIEATKASSTSTVVKPTKPKKSSVIDTEACLGVTDEQIKAELAQAKAEQQAPAVQTLNSLPTFDITQYGAHDAKVVPPDAQTPVAQAAPLPNGMPGFDPTQYGAPAAKVVPPAEFAKYVATLMMKVKDARPLADKFVAMGYRGLSEIPADKQSMVIEIIEAHIRELQIDDEIPF